MVDKRKAGVAESVMVEITGHSTRAMIDRYNVVDEDDARSAIGSLESFLLSVDHTVDQGGKLI